MSKRIIVVTILLGLTPLWFWGQNVEETNKQIAKGFFTDLWFTNQTENYASYVNETYRVHDIGERKNVEEPAIEQKNIADFFWENGELSGEIDFQIAEGDLVATRWIASFEPQTLLGRILIGKRPIPIVNIFRIENGKIVEFWNHRHDIDTPQTLRFVGKGFLIGLLISMIPIFYVIRLRRKLTQIRASNSQIE